MRTKFRQDSDKEYMYFFDLHRKNLLHKIDININKHQLVLLDKHREVKKIINKITKSNDKLCLNRWGMVQCIWPYDMIYFHS